MLTESPVILCVDDDSMSRDVLQVLLETVMGFPTVSYFENSQDFMTQIHALDVVPTLIFLDIQIRPYDGYEMLSMLRNDPAFSEATIIALTAHVMATDITKFREAGFNGLIGKPLNNRNFPDLVNQILAGEQVWHIT